MKGRGAGAIRPNGFYRVFQADNLDRRVPNCPMETERATTDDTAYACSNRYLAAHDTLRSAGPTTMREGIPGKITAAEKKRTREQPCACVMGALWAMGSMGILTGSQFS